MFARFTSSGHHTPGGTPRTVVHTPAAHSLPDSVFITDDTKIVVPYPDTCHLTTQIVTSPSSSATQQRKGLFKRLYDFFVTGKHRLDSDKYLPAATNYSGYCQASKLPSYSPHESFSSSQWPYSSTAELQSGSEIVYEIYSRTP